MASDVAPYRSIAVLTMSRVTLNTCCVCFLAVSVSYACRPHFAEDRPRAEYDFYRSSGSGVSPALQAGLTTSAVVRQRSYIGDSRSQFLMAAESDDVDPVAPRHRLLGKTPAPLRVRETTGAALPAWAHDADFFPNTLHVRLQI
jgi:hypothetical protein